MTKLIHVLRAGRLSYQAGLSLQTIIAKRVLNDPTKNILILTEHNPPVYTIGIRTKDYTLADELRLQALGAEFYRTNRGGLITFHGPGQLVVYPIINLKNFEPSLRWYICQIESTIIELCQQFGITAQRTKDTGIWVEDRKICAIGVHCSRYITTHGLALNCNTDLKWFEHIVPCGIEGKGVTSLSAELKKCVAISDVCEQFLKCFCSGFKCDSIIEFDVNEKKKIFNELNLVN